MVFLKPLAWLATLSALASVAACSGGGGGKGRAPAELPLAWESVTLRFSGSNNPHANVLCTVGGSNDFAGWSGEAVATQVGTAGTLGIGDSALAADGHFSWTECFDADGQCVGSAGTPAHCDLRYFGLGTSLGGRLQESQLVIRIDASLWQTAATIAFATPSELEPVAYAFGIVAIDGDGDGAINRSASGAIPPDAEELVGIAVEGNSLRLSAAGIRDGAPVAVVGTATFSLVSP